MNTRNKSLSDGSEKKLFCSKFASSVFQRIEYYEEHKENFFEWFHADLYSSLKQCLLEKSGKSLEKELLCR